MPTVKRKVMNGVVDDTQDIISSLSCENRAARPERSAYWSLFRRFGLLDGDGLPF